jgi:polyribonucleotide nucleotidyltransferase
MGGLFEVEEKQENESSLVKVKEATQKYSAQTKPTQENSSPKHMDKNLMRSRIQRESERPKEDKNKVLRVVDNIPALENSGIGVKEI